MDHVWDEIVHVNEIYCFVSRTILSSKVGLFTQELKKNILNTNKAFFMRILGIDPWLETIGFWIIDIKNWDFELVDFWVIKTSKKDWLDWRLLQIQEDINEILDEYNPNLVSIENLFFWTNVTNWILVAHARWVLLCEIAKRGMDIYEFAPNEMKSIICGYWKAWKKQVQEAVKEQLWLDKIPKPDDAADWIALAMCLGFRL